MPTTVIDYGECLKDSPRFRQEVTVNENNLDELETKMEKLLKACNSMTEGGRNYVGNQASFIASLWELSAHFSSDQETATTNYLNKLIQTFQEVLKLQNSVIDQTNKTIGKTLTKFLKEDVKKMHETKGYFNKISSDLDSALVKNAATSKSRPTELEDSSNLLTATKSCFRYTSMDYVHQITMLQSHKRSTVLASLAELVTTYSGFFRQGIDLFSDMGPWLQSLNDQIKSMDAESLTLEKQLERRHTYIAKEDTFLYSGDTKKGNIKIEGYLFKRGQNAFRTWNRRWFYLDSNKLCYVKRNGEDVNIMEEDLRICMVRPLNEIDRRFCFEVISPTKSHVLQADSEKLYQFWMTSLQQGISSALHEAMEPETVSNSRSTGVIQWEDSDTEEAQDSKAASKKPRRNATQILRIPGNEVCCDCSAPDPYWATTNYGATLCIECGGIHRSLGVHISKVKSIKLDIWEPEVLKVMAELGNTIVNQIFERKINVGNHVKPGPDATRSQREAWIIAKYKDKAFVDKDIFTSSGMESGAALCVSRLRRRARPPKKSEKKKEDKNEEEKEVDTAMEKEEGEEELSLLESVLEAGTLARTQAEAASSSKQVLNAENVLFGNALRKHEFAALELESDQESTDEDSETRWVPPQDPINKLTPDLLLFRAARAHNLPVMLEAMAIGADIEWKNKEEGCCTAIHQAVLSGSVMSTELLILNGANIEARDEVGNTVLHIAALHGYTGQVCLLLKHRGDHHAINNAGCNPLEIAVCNSDADIVTLLRLAALNEEIRESDLTGDDATFNDVVQEFSQMVYTHPERLNRNKK